MANGFLSPSGEFVGCNNREHFDCARKILKELGYKESEYSYPVEPPDFLCDKEGYIHLNEYYNGFAGGIREEKYDGVHISKKSRKNDYTYDVTKKQTEWISENMDKLSFKQVDLLIEMIDKKNIVSSQPDTATV